MTTKDTKATRARKAPHSRKPARPANPERRPGHSTSRPAGEKRRTSHSATRPSGSAQRPKRNEVRRTKPVRRPSRRNAESQVVYTPPKPFNKLRFLLGIAIAAAVVLALTLGMSIFFKVGENRILISGTHKYTEYDIREASGIQEGDNLLTLGKARVAGKIIAQLPYVDHVRIGIKLPDTVNIEITELEVLYAIQGVNSEGEIDSWWFVNGQGRVLDQTTGVIADNYTKILGVCISDPVIGQQAVPAVSEAAQETIAIEVTTPDGETETAPPAPIEILDTSEMLKTALTIVNHMEENGIIGDVTYVDVSNMYDLQIMYDNRYQVLLGDSSQLSYKIRSMEQAAQQMSDYQQGVLDVSFTTWPNSVGYTPFED